MTQDLWSDRTFIQYVKQSVNVELILSALGIQVDKSYSRTARSICPFHGGNNKTSFSIDLVTGNWTCFSSGCHEGYSDIIGLVQLSRKCSFKESLKFVATIMGIQLSKDLVQEVRRAYYNKDIIDFTRRQTKARVIVDLSSTPSIEEEVESWIQNRSNYFYNMGYSKATQDYFELGFHYDPKGIPRATIPIRDANGRFVAVDGRRTDSNDEPRYFMQPFGFSKSSILYHYFKAKDYLRIYNGDLFVVEGYKACWSMIQAGLLNTVACMGAGFSSEQPQILLRDLNLKRVIMVLDGDEAGKNGSRRARKQLGHFLNIEVVDLPDTEPVTDPSSLDCVTLRNVLKKYLT